MIANLGDLKRFLGIDRTDEDGRLYSALKMAHDEACRYCGRVFAFGEHTEYYDGNGQMVLYVDEPPIASITAIYDDADREFGNDTLIDSDDYTFDSESGAIYFDYKLSDGNLNVKVVYKGGYGTDSEAVSDYPNDLREAILNLATYNYLGMALSNMTMENNGQRSEYKDRATEILNRYRIKLI